jgi:lipoprotein-anchoring transpeptidase ErfK/SrfK
MAKITRIITLAALLLMLFPMPVAAQAQNETTQPETYNGGVLCLPDEQPQNPDCLLYGPAATFSELAQKGITFPQRPLPAVTPDYSLNEVDLKFARVAVPEGEEIKLFATLEAAVAGESPIRTMGASQLTYISYKQRVDTNGGHYLLTTSNAWLRASPASYHIFQGLLFQRNPSISFGWIVEENQPRTEPNYNAAVSDVKLPREQVVQIYDVKNAFGTDWYLVGYNQWVERRYIRQVKFNPTPPNGVDNNRWIEVNLYEQTLQVYENGNLVFATLIASGVKPFYTQPGVFKIYKKKPTETMSGAFEKDRSDFYYLEDVPWTMYFDQSRALHGAYWRAWYGYPQSHGCVNLSIGDARWLYDWAKEGDYVHVWDPSGQTPTDPNYYTKGGA